MRILHLFHHKDTVEIANALNVAQPSAHELLIRIHIVCLNFQYEIIFPTRIIALSNLVDSLYSLHEIIHQLLRMMPKTHIAEHRNAITTLSRV